MHEVWVSSELLFSNKLSWLLILGPIALIGDSTGTLGEAACFALSGIALIPCAERLSFVTEQVAEHTNGTIGALLNATFGNAPELLIATAALRSGFYRVVQLAMLGSMLTNLLLVFGMSCLVGGLRWQVQELRITSGNVSVGMLLLSVAGSLLPATLILSGQLKNDHGADPTRDDIPSKEELQFSRVNALIMVCMYGFYLTFQLGTHKDEFDEEENIVESAEGHQLHLTPHYTSRHGRQLKARRNLFVLNFIERFRSPSQPSLIGGEGGELELSLRRHTSGHRLLSSSDDEASNQGGGDSDLDSRSDGSDATGGKLLPHNEAPKSTTYANGYFEEYNDISVTSRSKDSGTDPTRRRRAGSKSSRSKSGSIREQYEPGRLVPLGLADPVEESPPPTPASSHRHAPQMSFRCGIVWLFVITLCISAMSDILVDTIDGFASRARLSEVFTSMVIVPFFSNVAEQVSAVLFAYRNEMDLCVGVTVGSAIQVMNFVLPGCVLIGLVVDRSMTLYFHAYETVCLTLAVIVVAAVLQGGTTNWMVGTTLISIYVMMATGFWFHQLEDLSIDAESLG